MIFKNCPECQGTGAEPTDVKPGMITFERCKLCHERTLWKKQFEKVAKNVVVSVNGRY